MNSEMRIMYGETNAISLLLIYDVMIPVLVVVIGVILVKYVCKSGINLSKSQKGGNIISTLLPK